MQHDARPVVPVRAMKLVHSALTLALVITTSALVVARYLTGALDAAYPPAIGHAIGAAGAVLAFIALGVIRRRIPERGRHQDADSYWNQGSTQRLALVAWSLAEGGGMLSAIGYFLTGSNAAFTALLFSVVALLWLRPARLEGEA
ncbi:MAG: hypothetical protein KatS3mg081_1048 [Gemmatimonadales bacterium]|nr:MAG: hypothetical protein KatS3mg081_1048 [Gemmatimonadales bacterium]